MAEQLLKPGKIKIHQAYSERKCSIMKNGNQ